MTSIPPTIKRNECIEYKATNGNYNYGKVGCYFDV
jgi:hypothetical protein